MTDGLQESLDNLEEVKKSLGEKKKEEWFIFTKDDQKASGPYKSEKEADAVLYKLIRKAKGDEADDLYVAEKPRR